MVNCSEQALAPEGAGTPWVSKAAHHILKHSSFQLIAFVVNVGIAINHLAYVSLLLIHNEAWMAALPSQPARQLLQAVFG